MLDREFQALVPCLPFTEPYRSQRWNCKNGGRNTQKIWLLMIALQQIRRNNHTFGKTHGAGDASLLGPEPEAASIEEQGLGWKSKFGTGKGGDTVGSGLEVIWSPTPTKWSNNFFGNLFSYEWELTESGWCVPVEAEGWRRRRYRAGCARPVKASRAIHADH